MSASDQLIVSTAIVRRLNPNCGFVLLDKLEQLDPDTMARFGAWLQEEGLQAIATRVSTNAEECTLIISDGTAAGEEEKMWSAEALPPAGVLGARPLKLCEAQPEQQASGALLADGIGQAAPQPDPTSTRQWRKGEF